MSDEKSKQIRQMADMIPSDWDRAPLALAHEIRGFLESVKDEGSSIDSGTDGRTGDLWVTVQGTEYFINIKKSNAQLIKEGRLLPPSRS